AAVLATHAAARARRIRLMRTLRRLAVAVAPIAACAAIMVLHSGGMMRQDPSASDGVRPMAALVALATVVTEGYDDFFVQDDGGTDVEFGSDFDTFAESIVLMQESPCCLNAMFAGE